MAIQYPLVVRWTQGAGPARRSIPSRDAGLALFEELRHETKSEPTMVEFAEAETGLVLAIGAGRPLTVLTYQATDDPPYFTSRGHLADAPAEVWFLYGGEDTPYPGFSAVAIEDGLAALEDFLTSGDRSLKIEWEQL